MAFNNGFDIMSAPCGGFLNTEKDKAKIETKTISMEINFSTPVTVAELGDAPYNLSSLSIKTAVVKCIW